MRGGKANFVFAGLFVVAFSAAYATGYSQVALDTFVGDAPLRLSITPAQDSINTGDSLTLKAIAYDVIGIKRPSVGNIVWQVVDSLATSASLRSVNDSEAVLTPHRGYVTAVVIAKLVDAVRGVIATDTAIITVRPYCLPNHLSIESTSDLSSSPNRDNPVGTIHLVAGFPGECRVYAIMRDPYGNFVCPVTGVVWSSTDTAVVKVVRGDSVKGEAIITAGSGAAGGNASVVVSYTGADIAVTVIITSWTDAKEMPISGETHEQVNAAGSAERVTIRLGRHPGSAIVDMLTPQGRLVRRLTAPAWTTGVTWDMKNEGGEVVRAGFYVARIRAGGAMVCRTVTVFK